MSVTTSFIFAPPLQVAAVEASDSRRLIGAPIDALVSVAMAVLTVLANDAYGNRLDRLMSLPEAVAVLVVGWALDVLLDAVPLSGRGSSIGNLLTGRRVVDAQTGARLPLRRAVRRYFARRNVLRWQADVDRRTLEAAAERPQSNRLDPA